MNIHVNQPQDSPLSGFFGGGFNLSLSLVIQAAFEYIEAFNFFPSQLSNLNLSSICSLFLGGQTKRSAAFMLLSPQVAPVYEIAIPVESISESEKGSYVFCKLVLKLTISRMTLFLLSPFKMIEVIPHTSRFWGQASRPSLIGSQMPKYHVKFVCEGGVSLREVTRWIPFKSSKL